MNVHGEETLADSFQDMLVFDHLEEEEVNRVLEKTSAVEYEAGAIIVEEDVVCGALYFVEQGVVDVLKSTGTGLQQIARLEAKTVFGEMGLVSGNPSSARVIAVSAVKARVLTRASLLELIRDGDGGTAKLIFNLARVLAARLRYLDERFVNLASQGKANHLASEIDDFRASLFSDWDF
tara:strand:+ start:103 stop:639 length:537 start_codon:yes stop_codon:yes gene_type:complete